MTRKYSLAAICICLYFLLFILLMIGLVKINLFETKIIAILGIFLLIFFVFSIYSYFSKNAKIYNIGVFLSFLLDVILLYNIVDLNVKYEYIMDIFKNEYKYIPYNVYVQRKTTMYDNISKLDGRKIGLLENNANKVESSFDNLINVEFLYYNDILEIENAIYNGEIQSFILTEEEFYNSQNTENSVLRKVRIIYTDKYKVSR